MTHRLGRFNRNCHLFLPRIVPANPQAQRAIFYRHFHAVSCVDVDIQRIFTRRVEIMTNRGQYAGDIWRTTSAAKPTLAERFNVIVDMVEFQRFWMYFQRIHIEEMFAIQCHAAEHSAKMAISILTLR